MIQVEDVSKTLGTFRLEHINIELPPGYIMGLVGENGAGKTTLLHLILGLYRPKEGSITIDGMNYDESEHAIRDRIGTVLLDDLFDRGRTLRANADFYGKYYQNYSSTTLEEYLERFGLLTDRRYGALSKGEKLKYQFAFALSHAPRLLVLDEPTGNFDPAFREEFWSILKEFIADGTRSVILSTHLTGDLERMADYITYLSHGKMVVSADIEQLRDGYRILTGETYKIRLIPKESILFMEEGAYGTRALVKHRKRNVYDSALTVNVPTIEELMYFVTKGGKRQ